MTVAETRPQFRGFWDPCFNAADNNPLPRHGHSLVHVNVKNRPILYLVGGDSPHTSANRYLLKEKRWDFLRFKVAPLPPQMMATRGGTCYGAVATDSANHIWSFGGELVSENNGVNNGENYGDNKSENASPPLLTWTMMELECATSTWKLVQYAKAEGRAEPGSALFPAPRKGATLTYIPVRQSLILLFGEGNGGALLRDVWEFDVRRRVWREYAAFDLLPAARAYHATVFHKNSLVVTGGIGAADAAAEAAWKLDLGTLEWTPLPAWPGPGRAFHSSCIFADMVVVAHGSFLPAPEAMVDDGPLPVARTMLALRDGAWEALDMGTDGKSDAATSNEKMALSASAMSLVGNDLYIFGGRDAAGRKSNLLGKLTLWLDTPKLAKLLPPRMLEAMSETLVFAHSHGSSAAQADAQLYLEFFVDPHLPPARIPFGEHTRVVVGVNGAPGPFWPRSKVVRLRPRTEYSARLLIVGNGVRGTSPSVVCKTADFAASDPPFNVKVKLVHVRQCEVTSRLIVRANLQWTPPVAEGGLPCHHYRLEHRVGGKETDYFLETKIFAEPKTPAMPIEIPLSSGALEDASKVQDVFFRLRIVNLVGPSLPSNAAVLNKAVVANYVAGLAAPAMPKAPGWHYIEEPESPSGEAAHGDTSRTTKGAKRAAEDAANDVQPQVPATAPPKLGRSKGGVASAGAAAAAAAAAVEPIAVTVNVRPKPLPARVKAFAGGATAIDWDSFSFGTRFFMRDLRTRDRQMYPARYIASFDRGDGTRVHWIHFEGFASSLDFPACPQSQLAAAESRGECRIRRPAEWNDHMMSIAEERDEDWSEGRRWYAFYRDRVFEANMFQQKLSNGLRTIFAHI